MHYNFTTKEDFEKGIETGRFLEYARVHSNIYGTAYKVNPQHKRINVSQPASTIMRRSLLSCHALQLPGPMHTQECLMQALLCNRQWRQWQKKGSAASWTLMCRELDR